MSPKVQVYQAPTLRTRRPEELLDRLLERSLSAAFGAQAWLRHSHTDKTHTTGRAYNKGEPDYVGVIHGCFVAIENKVHPNYPDDDQCAYLMKIARSSGLALLLVHDKRQGEKAGYYLIQVPDLNFEFSWRSSRKDYWIHVPYVEYGEHGILDLRVLHGLVCAQILNKYQSVIGSGK